jgi:hypothetical protein
MPEYRIYRLASDGHFWGVPVTGECAQDQEAIEKAGGSLMASTLRLGGGEVDRSC